MSAIPESIKTHETQYLEKLAEYERVKDLHAKTQFELLNAQDAAFTAFKKWSSVKEQFLVELINNRNGGTSNGAGSGGAVDSNDQSTKPLSKIEEEQ